MEASCERALYILEKRIYIAFAIVAFRKFEELINVQANHLPALLRFPPIFVEFPGPSGVLVIVLAGGPKFRDECPPIAEIHLYRMFVLEFSPEHHLTPDGSVFEDVSPGSVRELEIPGIVAVAFPPYFAFK
jgi:hypothetical protein